MSLGGAIKAGRAFVEITGDRNPLDRVLADATASLASFGASVSAIGSGVFAAGAGIVTPIVAAAKSFASTGDELDELSARTGVSTQSLTELGLAMKLAGVETADFETALRKSNSTIADAGRGSKEANAALAAVGLTFEDLAGLDPEGQFLAIGKAIDRLGNSTAKSAAAQDLFGRSAAKMFPLFQQGAKGIDDARAASTALGLTFTDSEIQQAVRLADAFDVLGSVTRRTFDAIGSAVAPIVSEVTESITNLVAGVNRWIQANPGAVQSALQIGAAIAGVGAAVTAGGVAILGLAGAILAGELIFTTFAGVIAGIGTAIAGIGSAVALIATPIGAVALAATGVAGSFLYFSGVGGDVVQYLIDAFGQLRDWVGEVVGAIGNALAAGDIKAAAEVLWASLQVVWTKGVGTLQEALRPFYDGWVNLVAGVRTVWEQATRFIVDSWITALDTINQAQSNVTDFFAGLLGADAATIAEDRAERDRKQFEETDRLRVQSAADSAAALEKIEADRMQGLLANHDAVNAALEDEKKAQDALAGAIGKANAARSDLKIPDRIRQRQRDTEPLANLSFSREAVGTFSGAALGQITGSITALDVQKKIDERIQKSNELLLAINNTISRFVIGV